MNELIMKDCSIIEQELEEIGIEIQETIENKSKDLERNLNNEISEIKDEKPDVEGLDAVFDIDFDVEWKDTEILIPWVEVVVKLKKIKIDLPQVSMKRKKIVFHTPSTRMVKKKTGDVPQVYCDGLKCKIKMKPTYIRIPEFFMEKQVIKIDIPEFKIDTTTMDIPDVRIKFSQKKIIMGLPQFTVRKISVQVQSMEDKANKVSEEYKEKFSNVSKEAQALASADLSNNIVELFECHKNNVKVQEQVTLKSIDNQIALVEQQYNAAKSKGIAEAIQSIEKTLSELILQRKSIKAEFDTMIDSFNKAEMETIKEIVG